jgi:predicted dehydrogenase
MKYLTVGIIGAGGIVRERHAPALRELPGVEIAAVANGRRETAHAFCEEFAPGAKVLADWRDLIKREDLDIVWIGAAPFLHEPASVAALEANRHVFCQARMATDAGAAERMLAAAQAHPHLVTMLCPPPCGLKIDAFIKKLLADGRVGDLVNVRLRSLSGIFSDPRAPAHWRQQTEISGHNILTLGIHTEVLHRWLGHFHVVSADAKVLVKERDGYRIRTPDALTVHVEFEGGAGGILEFSGVHSGPATETLEIAGTRGSLMIDYLTDTVSFSAPGRAPDPMQIPEDLLRAWSVEVDFIEAVRHPELPRPHPDFQDGLAYMKVVDRVWKLAAC